jgi:hypothetical protein
VDDIAGVGEQLPGLGADRRGELIENPREKSGGVDGVLAAATRPPSSAANASVNVPPMSIPIT